jgi:hypothetical protein
MSAFIAPALVLLLVLRVVDGLELLARLIHLEAFTK